MNREVAAALLGLPNEPLSPERVNEAYRAAMQMNHPDRYANNERLRRHAEEQCKLINEAREVLLSRNYDTEPEKSSEREPTKQQHKNNQSQSPKTSEQQDTATENKQQPQAVRASLSPFLDIWRTSIGASVLGVLTSIAIPRIDYMVPESMTLLTGLVRLAFVVFQLIYAAAIYPSLFSLKPKLKTSFTVSFWNCAVGGIIFGPLWNSNLTKRHKGISNIVCAVMVSLLAAYWLIMFGFAISLLAVRY